MAEITINATKRTITGKEVKHLRQAGKLPAVVYGHERKAENLEVSENEFLKAFKAAGESTIIDLNVDGQKTPVLIQDVHMHYLTDQPIHVDFYAVNMTEKLTATVQLHFVGEAPAVKALGAILAKNLSEIEVECLPTDLPPFLEVDISGLANFDDAIRIADLKVSDKVKILPAPEELVVSVTEPRSEDDLKALDEKPVAADVTAVEGVAKPTDAAEGEEAKEDKKKAE